MCLSKLGRPHHSTIQTPPHHHHHSMITTVVILATTTSSPLHHLLPPCHNFCHLCTSTPQELPSPPPKPSNLRHKGAKPLLKTTYVWIFYKFATNSLNKHMNSRTPLLKSGSSPMTHFYSYIGPYASYQHHMMWVHLFHHLTWCCCKGTT